MCTHVLGVPFFPARCVPHLYCLQQGRRNDIGQWKKHEQHAVCEANKINLGESTVSLVELMGSQKKKKNCVNAWLYRLFSLWFSLSKQFSGVYLCPGGEGLWENGPLGIDKHVICSHSEFLCDCFEHLCDCLVSLFGIFESLCGQYVFSCLWKSY